MKLTADVIYEAALDDQLFAQLPALIARSTGARSCVLHWRHQDGAAEVFTHSGHFSDGHMADYAANFASHDLWTEAGMRQGRVNQAWNTTDLVPTSDYERSVFFNEWIRAMGDDTFYCCGSVMRTAHGHGIIGLHRGRTQSDFSPSVLRQLNEQVPHLHRMFAIRGRVASLTERRDLLNSIFEAGSQPALAVTSGGRLVVANAPADALLRSARFLRLRNGQLLTAIEEDRQALEQAIAAASAPDSPTGSDCLLRAGDGSAAIVSVLPLCPTQSQATALVTVSERTRLSPQIVGRHLQRAYRLSAAEAEIALRLADGQTIGEIAEERRASTGTVRSQVKQILSKMDAKRQSDVVRAVTLLR